MQHNFNHHFAKDKTLASKGTESRMWKRHLHYSQEPRRKQPKSSLWMDGQTKCSIHIQWNIIHPEKGGRPMTWWGISELWGHYAKWNSHKKVNLVCFYLLEVLSHHNHAQKVNWELPELRAARSEETAWGCSFKFYKMERYMWRWTW